MKIGILTFHNAHNYGAVLQAYALKTYIQSKGYNVSIINYRNSTIQKAYLRKLSVKFGWRDFLSLSEIKRKVDFRLNIKYMQSAWERQYDAFETFICRYLTDTSEVLCEDITNGDWDVLIVGSDQIWTSGLTGGLDKVYLLDFPLAEKVKKVAYAASAGGGEIIETEKDIFSKCLKKFDYLSVREYSLAKSIQSCCTKTVETVLDPTLLLDKDAYAHLIDCEMQIKGKYVFCYYVIESPKLRECALKVAHELGLRLIELHYYMKKEFDPENQKADYSPAEFLSAISGAEIVLTNSFHGTVFSILYQKNFYAVYDKNTRIQNLLDSLDISDRHITNKEELNLCLTVDYSKVGDNLEKLRKKSYEYLEKVLDIEVKN